LRNRSRGRGEVATAIARKAATSDPRELPDRSLDGRLRHHPGRRGWQNVAFVGGDLATPPPSDTWPPQLFRVVAQILADALMVDLSEFPPASGVSMQTKPAKKAGHGLSLRL
jgi:hypothetical protein